MPAKEKLGWAIVISSIIITALIFFKFGNICERQEIVSHTQYTTEMQSTDDGCTLSITRCLITTPDGKTYAIESTGLGARPELIGFINLGEELHFVSRGYGIEPLKVYPWIDKIIKE